jgi:hypothetical protein
MAVKDLICLARHFTVESLKQTVAKAKAKFLAA